MPSQERRDQKMAEDAVAFLINKLSELLSQEANLLYGVEGDIILLREQLEFMAAFLKEADRRPKEDEIAKTWVNQIREVSYDAEDVINEFVLKIERRRRNVGFMAFVEKYIGCVSQQITLHDMRSKIDSIKTRVQEMARNKSMFSIGESSTSASGPKEKQPPIVEELDVVGFEDDQKTIVGRLIGGDQRCVVVSIVGMGGLGKTTLAKKVYNSDLVTRHFQCRGWVYVSQEYRARELLLALVKCFMVLKREEMEMGEEELVKKLCNYLKKRRYLIVIDDIWKTEAWDSLEAAFPDGTKGSRVLLTTRNENVALHADVESLPYQLRFLREDESWSLFCKKAFPRNVGNSCPPELKMVAQEIVGKCGGLALALVVLGGLLSRKHGIRREWEKVRTSVGLRLPEGQKQISRILALSYNDLPYYLKSCFLYFGVFPEDFEIPARKLIQLWVAEGLIRQSEYETMEEVAEDYLEELIHRSMIQLASKRWTGQVKTCRIHDLLRDLSIEEAKQDRFLHIVGNVDSQVRARRLAIYLDLGMCVSLNLSTPHIHSLLCFKVDDIIRNKEASFIYERFKLLRVLDLEKAYIVSLPKEIGELIHLRFLGLCGPFSVPSSIYNLHNLQTLRMKKASSVTLGSGIWNLQNLRHIYIPTSIKAPQACSPSKNLQTLSMVKVDSWVNNGLAKLTNLRNLGLSGDFCKHQNALKFSRHVHLYKLKLYGELPRLSKLDEFPPKLRKLVLSESGLSQGQLTTFEALPNLEILILWERSSTEERRKRSYREEKMVFSTGGFGQLKELKLDDLYELKELEVEPGAMPNLKHLVIKHCVSLKEVPKGLVHLTTIEELNFEYMPSQFVDRVRENDGEDWYKVRHIPSINVIEPH